MVSDTPYVSEGSSSSTIRILICDDHKLIQNGLMYQLKQNGRFQVVGVLQDGADLVSFFDHQKNPDCCLLDVLLLDFSLPESAVSNRRFDVLAFTKKLQEQCPTLKIVFITMFDQPSLAQTALKHGASGFFTKDDTDAMENLPALICKIVDTEMIMISKGLEIAGEREKILLDFSPTQNTILKIILNEPSISSALLAERLCIANSTVRNQLSRIYRRLGVSSRAEAVLILQRHGWRPILEPAQLNTWTE